MKKTLSLLLAVLMLLGTCSAFADTSILTPEGYPVVTETITVSLTGPREPTSKGWDAENCAQVAYLSEMTGIVFVDRSLTKEAWDTTRNLLLASDDIPDVILSYNPGMPEISDLGSQGILIPLEGLIEQYMPNLQNVFAKFPGFKALITSADGHIYTLPLINQVVRDVHQRYWINVKWLEAVNKEIPTTLDELYDVLMAFKTEDADQNGDPNNEIPCSASVGNYGLEGMILNALGVNSYTPVYGYTNDSENKVYCYNISDAYKEYLLYMNKLWTNGLLDEEYFTQTSEQRVAKAKEGIIGTCQTGTMYIDAGTEIGYNWEQFDALTSDINSTKMVTSRPFIKPVCSITKACQNPEAVCRAFDYLYSEEGMPLGYVGVEGISWEWVDKEAGTWEKIAPEGYESAEEFRYVATIYEGLPRYTSATFNKGQGSFNALWLDDMSYNRSYPYFVSKFPSLSMSEEANDLIQAYEADLTSYISNMRATFICGTPEQIEAGWDAYVEQVKAMGVSELLPYYQEAYDAFLAASK